MICTRYGAEKAGIDYLLRNPTAKVLHGDPDWVSAIISVAGFKQRFMSGAISWNPGEIPSDVEMDEVIRNYTRHLNRERDIPVLWVLHTKKRKGSDKKAVHIHFVVPQVDSETGKLFQPYLDRNDRSRFDNLCEGLNAQFGWTSSNIYKGSLDRDDRLLLLQTAEEQLRKRMEKDAVRYRHVPRRLRGPATEKSKKIKKLPVRAKKRDKTLDELCRRIIAKGAEGDDGIAGGNDRPGESFGREIQHSGGIVASIDRLAQAIGRAIDSFQGLHRVLEEATRRITKLCHEFDQWKKVNLKTKVSSSVAVTKSKKMKDDLPEMGM